jgi:hypothetical protein
MRPGSRHLLQILLEDRRALGYRNLLQPASHGAALPEGNQSVRGADVLHPVALLTVGTRYQRSANLAMPRGKRVVRPEHRPVTSNVTHRRGIRPALNTAAQILAYRRAEALARPFAYMARSRPLEMGNPSMIGALPAN